MPIKKSVQQKRKEVLAKEKLRWVNTKLLNEILEKKLRAKISIEEKLREEEMKRRRMFELLSIKY